MTEGYKYTKTKKQVSYENNLVATVEGKRIVVETAIDLHKANLEDILTDEGFDVVNMEFMTRAAIQSGFADKPDKGLSDNDFAAKKGLPLYDYLLNGKMIKAPYITTQEDIIMHGIARTPARLQWLEDNRFGRLAEVLGLVDKKGNRMSYENASKENAMTCLLPRIVNLPKGYVAANATAERTRDNKRGSNVDALRHSTTLKEEIQGWRYDHANPYEAYVGHIATRMSGLIKEIEADEVSPSTL